MSLRATSASLVFLVGLCGCTSTTEPATLTLTELCDSPERYDGEMIEVELDLSPSSVRMTAVTAVACSDDDPCCNYAEYIHRQVCPGNARDLLVLPAGTYTPPTPPGGSFVCHGENDGVSETNAACAAPSCPLTGPTTIVGTFNASDPAWEDLPTLQPVEDPADAP